ncbi:MAG: hypothetical protein ACREJP_10835, partial [Candidatus Methylomirabilales bacterium]
DQLIGEDPYARRDRAERELWVSGSADLPGDDDVERPGPPAGDLGPNLHPAPGNREDDDGLIVEMCKRLRQATPRFGALNEHLTVPAILFLLPPRLVLGEFPSPIGDHTGGRRNAFPRSPICLQWISALRAFALAPCHDPIIPFRTRLSRARTFGLESGPEPGGECG